MKWIMFINGPLAGQMSEVEVPQDNYFALQEPDPFLGFAHADDPIPSSSVLSERIVYYPIPDTRNPIKYMTNTFDRAQEVINFVRSLGFTLDANQEQVMRYWFKGGDTQDDSFQP